MNRSMFMQKKVIDGIKGDLPILNINYTHKNKKLLIFLQSELEKTKFQLCTNEVGTIKRNG